MLNTRLAVEDDIPTISTLIRAAMTHLMTVFLTEPQIEASFQFMGVDTQLIADRTYFVVESEGEIVGCGGWSRRATLYGGDHSQTTRDAALLNPQTDAARVRAMYTRPDHTRRGVGRLILEECEAAASAAGFARAELMATMPGEPFYQALRLRRDGPHRGGRRGRSGSARSHGKSTRTAAARQLLALLQPANRRSL